MRSRGETSFAVDKRGNEVISSSDLRHGMANGMKYSVGYVRSREKERVDCGLKLLCGKAKLLFGCALALFPLFKAQSVG